MTVNVNIRRIDGSAGRYPRSISELARLDEHGCAYRVSLLITRGSDVVLDLSSTGANSIALLSWAYSRAVDFLRRGT